MSKSEQMHNGLLYSLSNQPTNVALSNTFPCIYQVYTPGRCNKNASEMLKVNLNLPFSNFQFAPMNKVCEPSLTTV